MAHIEMSGKWLGDLIIFTVEMQIMVKKLKRRPERWGKRTPSYIQNKKRLSRRWKAEALEKGRALLESQQNIVLVIRNDYLDT